MDKRGISPVIVTILIISLAVGLGIAIMNLGKAYVQEEAQCPIAIGLTAAVINEQQQFCYNKNKKEVQFTVENGVNINVNGLILNVIGTNKADTFELNDAKISKAGAYVGRVPYDSSKDGEIRQIKISPKVVLYDVEQICNEKALLIEKIEDCGA